MKRWWQWRKRSRCPHSELRPIHGDEIIFSTPDWNRLQCLDCGRFLDGPVVIAYLRKDEPDKIENHLLGVSSE